MSLPGGIPNGCFESNRVVLLLAFFCFCEKSNGINVPVLEKNVTDRKPLIFRYEKTSKNIPKKIKSHGNKLPIE